MLYVAYVTACLASGNCITLEDMLGLYRDLPTCERRVGEMVREAADLFSGLDDGIVRGWCQRRSLAGERSA